MKILLPITALLLTACGANKHMNNYKTFTKIPLKTTQPNNSELLANLLNNNPIQFAEILKNKDSLRLQIIFTQIDRNEKNEPNFNHHFYNVSDQYFYPASTVKFPTAVLALEKLNNLKIAGVNANTTMLTDSAWSGQTPVTTDATAQNGLPSIAQYVKKIMLVSDNDAYNRLYEFIGH
jgi:beta-lactamase class A